MRRFAPFAILLALASLLVAAANAPPVNLNDPAHEVQRLRLLSKFQRALLAQESLRAAQIQFDQARNEYTDLAEQTARELSLPAGVEFQIDAAKGTISVIMPPPAVKPQAAPVVPSEGSKP